MNHIDAETKSCALLGHPSGHSLSPVLHNIIANELGVNMVYTAYDVEPERLKKAVKGADALGFTGLNITVPHKEAVIPYLKDLDSSAERIGSVNTLVRIKKGKGFKGYNTDLPGLMRALDADNISFYDKNALVIGAGGAARTAVTMLALHGAKSVTIVNRTAARGESLMKTVKKTTGYEKIKSLTEEEAIEDMKKNGGGYICFQCTSVGMYPEIDKMPVKDERIFEYIDTAFDLIYNPLETKFLRLAKEHGAKAYNGLKLLLYQGVIAFELWYDRMVPNEICMKAYDAMLNSLTNKKTIILTGFMGSGKTTVSRILADRLDEMCIEMDAVIESREKDTIINIMRERGEDAFRDMETKTLKKLAKKERLPFVLSTGGGVPIRDENRKLLCSLGTVVYLKTSADEVYRRIKDQMNRPLLMTDDPYRTIVAMEEAREEFYNMAADITVITDGKTPNEIMNEIIDKVFKVNADA